MHERTVVERKDFGFHVDVEFEKLPHCVTHVRLLDILLRTTSIKIQSAAYLLSILPQMWKG